MVLDVGLTIGVEFEFALLSSRSREGKEEAYNFLNFMFVRKLLARLLADA